VPVVHSDDVADALVRIVEQRAGGAFNLATEPPVTSELIASVLGARRLHVPSPILSRLARATWRARLQPLDPGWVRLAFAVPLLDTSRARTVLGWRPRHSAREAVADVVAGLTRQEGTASPALRPRTVREDVVRAVTAGLPGNRRRT
jgi:nucleoside-diphosphate-sugar epimerase